jgi:hypothetical protein
MERRVTQAAIAAKEIRQRLKAANIQARVTCSSFAGGNDVRVHLTNAAPEIVKAAHDIADPFEYGHFDGMDDSYKYSNRRDDLPAQVKFVFVENDRCLA